MANRDAVKFHDKLAASWGDRYLTANFRYRALEIVNLLEKVVKPNSRWLDAGAGDGFLSIAMSKIGAEVNAVDASARMISEIEKRINQASHPRISCSVVQSVENLPYAGASYDGILSSSVIEYLDNPNDWFTEAVRLLKPGGHFIFTVPNSMSLVRKFLMGINRLTRRVGNPSGDWRTYSKNQYTLNELDVICEQLSLHRMPHKFVGDGRLGRLNELAQIGTLILYHARKPDKTA